MTRSREMGRLLQPWAGLAAAVLAGGIAHQFGGEGMFDDCQRIGHGALQIVGLLCMLGALAGGWWSFLVLSVNGESNARRVVAVVSAGFAALVIFSILLPLIASVTLPPCFQ